jgi:hypothetical protein
LLVEEIKSRLKSGKACCNSVQNVLSYILPFKNVKIKIYRIFPPVLCGSDTWSFILREEHRLRVFENRVLRKISGPEREEVTGKWREHYR